MAKSLVGQLWKAKSKASVTENDNSKAQIIEKTDNKV